MVHNYFRKHSEEENSLLVYKNQGEHRPTTKVLQALLKLHIAAR